jgi:hypothetical protein
MKKLLVVCSILCAFAPTAIAGDKPAGGTRTVTGAFRTVYGPDDGSSTTLSTPPPFGQRPIALLVPDDSPTGYTEFPITLGGDNTFTIEGVPSGSYFLQLDISYDYYPVPFIYSNLFELTADSPDLSVVSAARPDLARVTTRTPVTLDITNMQPWQLGNHFLISSSQGDVYERPLLAPLTPPPNPGDTSYFGTFDWSRASTSANTPGLPAVAHGDVLFFNQRSTLRIGQGDSAADLRYASRYARLTDFTVTDGTPSTLMASLVETSMTGRMRADVRGSEFAALAPEVNPSARPTQDPFGNLGFSVLAVPHSVQYPDRPASSTSSLFYFQSVTPTSTNFDYGTFNYPQFHDSLWEEYRQLLYYFDVTLRVPGTKEPIELPLAAYAFSAVPMSPSPMDPMAPVLGPPTAPLINGEDAFVPHAGVGLQPVISWSPPDLGTATSYYVSIYSLSAPEAGERFPLALVHGGTSFKVPPGFLRPEHVYYGVISAYQSDFDALNRPIYRSGTPEHQTDCIIGAFTP